MSILYQGIIVENPWVLPVIDVCKDPVVDPKMDKAPVYLFAIQAWMSFVWWIVIMFSYCVNYNYLKSTAGINTIPLFWWWEHIRDPDYGWTAASYFTSFLAGFMVGFMELIGWFWYIIDRPEIFDWWTQTIGWWFSNLGLMMPWIFISFQLGLPNAYGGLNRRVDVEFGKNSVFILMGSFLTWISSMFVHTFFVDRLHCHFKSTESERVKIVYKKCPLKRTFGKPDSEYQQECKDLFASGKWAEKTAFSATEEEEAEDDE